MNEKKLGSRPTTAFRPVSKKRSFVVLSDLHAHPWAAFAQGDGERNTRLRRTLDVLRASLACAQESALPWVFGGDLVHTAGYALNVVLAELTNVLSGYDIPKLVVWGNHDSRGVGGRITLEQTIWGTLKWAVPNLTVLEPGDEPVEENGLTFSGSGAQPGELFSFAKNSQVGLYHGTVAGSVGPNGYCFEEGIDPEGLRGRHNFSVVGDIHHPQQMERILVPGSPEHHNFGDAGPHGWWVVSLPPHGTPELVFTPGGSPEFRTVETPDLVQADGNFYRVRSMPAGGLLPGNAVAIAPSPTVVASRDLLSVGANAEQAVQAWLQELPPEDDVELYRTAGRLLLAQQEPTRLTQMSLRQLRLENFCSYADTVLCLENGTWLVTGKGRDYPSNGAGKSSLFEAAYWLLFGRTTKGLTGDEVIRWGANGCRVTGYFQDPDGKWLKAVRLRGEASRLEVTEGTDGLTDDWGWEAESVNVMTEKLARRLGLTPELFQALSYFSQERLFLFASASDGERKNMLGDLIGLAAYQEASTQAAAKVAELERAGAALEGRCEAVADLLNKSRIEVTATQTEQANWNRNHEQAQAQAAHHLQAFEQRAPASLVAAQQLHGTALGAKLTGRINAQTRELEALSQQLEVYAGDGCPEPAPSELATVAAQRLHTQATEQLVSLKRDIAHATSRRDELVATAAEYARSLAEGTCPTCQQDVTPAHQQKCLAPIKQDIQNASAQLTLLDAELKKAVWMAAGTKVALEEAKETLADALEIKRISDAKEKAWSLLMALKEERADLEGAAHALAENDVAAARAVLTNQVRELAGMANPYDTRLTAAQQQVQALGKSLADLGTQRNDQARESAVYDYWRQGFSKQGIQSLLVEEVAGRFNAMRAEVFPALTQGVYDVQFSTLSRTKAGEARERTEFLVTERGKRVPYEALSGGQRRRVDVGVMLTLVMAVSAWMQVPGGLGLLVLDEVFGFLDAAGAEGLMEALRAVAAHVPSIYVVTHDAQLQALFPQVVQVEQDALGVSHIVED